MNAGNLIDFFNQFASEAKCAEFIAQQRWGNEIICPKCGVVGIKAYKLASGRLKCAECRKPFTVRMDTIFEDSMIPLQKWLLAIYLCTSLKKGISSIQLAKYLNVTQKTAWFMLQRIRFIFENGTFEKLKDAVEVEAGHELADVADSDLARVVLEEPHPGCGARVNVAELGSHGVDGRLAGLSHGYNLRGVGL